MMLPRRRWSRGRGYKTKKRKVELVRPKFSKIRSAGGREKGV